MSWNVVCFVTWRTFSKCHDKLHFQLREKVQHQALASKREGCGPWCHPLWWRRICQEETWWNGSYYLLCRMIRDMTLKCPNKHWQHCGFCDIFKVNSNLCPRVKEIRLFSKQVQPNRLNNKKRQDEKRQWRKQLLYWSQKQERMLMYRERDELIQLLSLLIKITTLIWGQTVQHFCWWECRGIEDGFRWRCSK